MVTHTVMNLDGPIMEISLSSSIQLHLFLTQLRKSQVMRVRRRNKSLRIKVGNRELKEIDNFKYLGYVLTRNAYYTREIKVRIAMAKEAFNRKMSLLTSKLNIELRKKKLVSVMFELLSCMAQRPGH